MTKATGSVQPSARALAAESVEQRTGWTESWTRWLKPDSTTSTLKLISVGAVVVALVLVMINGTYRVAFLSGPGIAQGALIAAVALGVILTYQGSGVVNIANGSIAMYTAYVYTTLRSKGDLFLPPIPNPLAPIEGIAHRMGNESFSVPHIPTSISFGPNMQFWPALLMSLLFCVVLGLMLHVLIFRPLRNAPALAKVVASVGVFLLLQAIILRRFAANAVPVKPMPFVDKSKVDLGFMSITQEQLFVAIFVIAAAVVLRVVFQRTRFGLSTRAAAENEKGAVVLGFSPDYLAGINWMMSTAVTGLLGIFVASINSNVDPFTIPGLIVPALSAALVGGFTSFGLATLTAFLIGMAGPLITTLGVRASWYPHSGSVAMPGVIQLIPLVVIVIVLSLRGNALPGRGGVNAGRMPISPTPGRTSLTVVGPIAIIITLLGALFWLPPEFRGGLTNTLIGVVLCLSVVVVTGYVGQISLAPMAFAGIAAYAVSHLSVGLGWPFPIPIFAGALVATVVGLIVALPALRIRGVALAIVTLSFALACQEFIFNNQDINGGTSKALVNTPKAIQQSRPAQYEILGFITAGDGKQPNPMTAVFCLVVAVVLAYLVANIRRSNTGRQFLAIRSNERAAAAAGVSVAGTKSLAFAVSAFIAGVGGAVMAYRAGQATYDNYVYTQSLLVFAWAYLGGLARVSGAVMGGVLVGGGLTFTLLQQKLGVPQEFTLLLGGLGLIIAPIMNPEGAIGGMMRNLAWLGVYPRKSKSGDGDTARRDDAKSVAGATA